jgi:excisionase family DNA binding protein
VGANFDDAFAPQIAALVSDLAELVARRTVEIQRELDGSASAATGASPWLSTATAAEYLDWPKGRLYKLSARGEIPHYKHEGRLLFRKTSSTSGCLALPSESDPRWRAASPV